MKLFLSLLVGLSIPVCVLGAETRYASGLFQDFADENRTNAGERVTLGRNEALSTFFSDHFAAPELSDFRWQNTQAISDATHNHLVYALHFRDRRVEGEFLRLHARARDGSVQYAASTWAQPAKGNLPSLAEPDEAARVRSLQRKLEGRLRGANRNAAGAFKGRVSTEAVYFREKGALVPAFHVKISVFAPRQFRDYVVEEGTGRLLAEYPVARFANYSMSGFKASPYGSGLNDAAPDVFAITTSSPNVLLSSYVHVRYEWEDVATQGTDLQEIDPAQAWAVGGNSSQTPSGYGYDTCDNTPVNSQNQGFDGGNIFYHLNTYRAQLDTYFSQLGVTPTMGTDPLDVIVNALDVGVVSNNPSQEANNAAYISRPCREDAAGNVIDRCLVFLHPAQIQDPRCGPTAVWFYDLGRDSLVIIHEFQHYITDSMGHFQSDSGSLANVGDAIHEGFSDYMAASQISALNGTALTKVGAYSFQECPFFIRDVGIPRVYTDTTSDGDPHMAGLTWASGLWKLRGQLGRNTVDLLALKSILFLPVKPGFVQVVEALVQADQALNQGVNVAAIRTLFYDQLKFTGSQTGFFRDTPNKVVELGFRSCASVSPGRTSGFWPLTLLLLWLQGTCLIGRRLGARKDKG